jgi:hypothetical protein
MILVLISPAMRMTRRISRLISSLIAGKPPPSYFRQSCRESNRGFTKGFHHKMRFVWWWWKGKEIDDGVNKLMKENTIFASVTFLLVLEIELRSWVVTLQIERVCVRDEMKCV